jgi:hypothetical protein
MGEGEETSPGKGRNEVEDTKEREECKRGEREIFVLGWRRGLSHHSRSVETPPARQ